MTIIYQEHQNLPAIPDIPLELPPDQREFFLAIKELLEVMTGRREDAPAVPQFQMGTYMGDGTSAYRQINVNFRPRLVQVYVNPISVAGAASEIMYQKMDDPIQSIDWGKWSFRHDDTDTTSHDWEGTYGIWDINDNGFTVYGGSTGGARPNRLDEQHDWWAMA